MTENMVDPNMRIEQWQKEIAEAKKMLDPEDFKRYLAEVYRAVSNPFNWVEIKSEKNLIFLLTNSFIGLN